MDQTLKRKFYLRQFKAISYAISNYEDLNVLINHFVEGLCLAFKFKGSSIMLYDDRERQLFVVGSYGLSDEYLNKGPVFYDDSESAFSKGEPVFVEDMHSDPRVQYPAAAASEGMVSMASFPIVYRKSNIGILRVYHAKPILLHEDDIDSICVLCQHLALVIENNGLKNFLDMVKGAIGSLPLRMLEGLNR